MLYSGADLIRTSGQQAERVERIKAAESVRAMENPGQSQSSLDGETQGALLRFARFVNDEKNQSKKQPPKPSKPAPPGLPAAYASQIGMGATVDGRGATLDIYA